LSILFVSVVDSQANIKATLHLEETPNLIFVALRILPTENVLLNFLLLTY